MASFTLQAVGSMMGVAAAAAAAAASRLQPTLEACCTTGAAAQRALGLPPAPPPCSMQDGRLVGIAAPASHAATHACLPQDRFGQGVVTSRATGLGSLLGSRRRDFAWGICECAATRVHCCGAVYRCSAPSCQGPPSYFFAAPSHGLHMLRMSVHPC